MNKKKILISFILALVLSIVICGVLYMKSVPPSIDKSSVLEDLKKSHSEIITIEKSNITALEISKEDKDILRRTFTDEVKAYKVGVSGVFNTSEVQIDGKYTLLYAYFNNKYKLVNVKDVDLKNRKYKPIGHVSRNTIYKDLRKMQIGGFKKGEVGKESNTSIEILSRNTDLDFGEDKISINIGVKSDFANTKINAKLKYIFSEDRWILKASNIEDEENFEVEFISNNLPKKPNEEAVKELLTNERLSTYTTNKSYTTKLYVSKPRVLARDKELIYEYIYIASYDGIGDIEYKVDIPYLYSDGEWIKDSVKIQFNKASLDKMKRMWYFGYDDKTKKFKEALEFTDSESSVLSGYYIVGDKKEAIKAEIKINQKEDNYPIIIAVLDNEDGKEPLLKDTNATLYLKDRNIVLGGNKFS